PLWDPVPVAARGPRGWAGSVLRYGWDLWSARGRRRCRDRRPRRRPVPEPGGAEPPGHRARGGAPDRGQAVLDPARRRGDRRRGRGAARRSEERRVGTEYRSRRTTDYLA